jgi:hypothetical protein
MLDNNVDYVLRLPSTPVHIDIPRGPNGETQAGIYLRRQPPGAVIHIEGVRFSGNGLHDGIELEQPDDTVVQLQNIRVDDLHAQDEVGFTDIHPDVVQTWSGPDVLRIDRLTGRTPYQGFFFEPNDDYWQGPHNIPTLHDLRRIDLRVSDRRTSAGGRMLWQSTPFPLALKDVFVDPGTATPAQTLWPSVTAWTGVQWGRPQGGEFVPEGTAGIGYVSPGYIGTP